MWYGCVCVCVCEVVRGVVWLGVVIDNVDDDDDDDDY